MEDGTFDTEAYEGEDHQDSTMIIDGGDLMKGHLKDHNDCNTKDGAKGGDHSSGTNLSV